MTELLEKCWNEYVQAMINDDPNVETIYNAYASVFENYIRALERKIR